MSGYCFCASEKAICWDGFSTASSATTCQRRKDSKSPVLRSIATRTSTSSLKRFFVAEAIAISRAPNTTSLWTFFSRASASACSSSSRLMYPSGIMAWAPGAHGPGEIPAAIDRMAQAHLGLVAGKAGKIRRLFQPAVQTRGGNLQPVVLDPLDFEHPLQLFAHGLAVGKGHPRPARYKLMCLLNKHA